MMAGNGAAKQMIFRQRQRRFGPKPMYFKEDMCMTLKNKVSGKYDRVTGDGCVAEMTTMLDCIKEHEFENTPCTSQIVAFEACMLKHKQTIKELRSVVRDGLLSDEKQKLTFAQINHMMAKYPQPGSHDRKPVRRSPLISYSDPVYPK